MRAINVFLAIVVSLVIGLGVFEVGLRLLGKGPERTMLEFDPVTGWAKQPGLSYTRSTPEFEVTYEINELGLRDDPMSDPSKPEGTFRVVVLGDSFVQGWSVPRKHLFVDQLERWWRAENRRVEVINAGTEGFSTDQQVAWFLEHGAQFEPDLVMIFPYENDIYWNAQTEYAGRQKPRFDAQGNLEQRELVDTSEKSWQDEVAILRLFRGGKKGLADEHFFTPEGSERRILKEQGVLLVDEPPFVAEAVSRTRGALTALKSACAKEGARLVMVPIPSHSVVDAEYREMFSNAVLGLSPDRWSPDRPVNVFLQLARDVGIDAFDPRTTLKAKADSEDLYYDRDWHFNPEGNRAFALYLHDVLDNGGYFPATHAAPSGAPVPLPEVPESAEAPTWIKVYAALWLVLSILYVSTYKDEPKWQPPLKVAGLLTVIFAIVLGGEKLLGMLPPNIAQALGILFVLGILGFIAFKLGRRLGTIAELFKSFVLRGHWYLMPLVVVLLTIGSLLVVAASSPLVAPFIYTLF